MHTSKTFKFIIYVYQISFIKLLLLIFIYLLTGRILLILSLILLLSNRLFRRFLILLATAIGYRFDYEYGLIVNLL